MKYAIGIDPGQSTGIAIWDMDTQVFVSVETTTAVNAEETVRKYGDNCIVLVEDARQRKWFGNSGPEKYQGAGWAKAASARWEEFLKYHGVAHRMMKPGKTWKGANAGAMFAKLTGWKGRTSNHARDAAWMVFQMAAGKAKMIVR